MSDIKLSADFSLDELTHSNYAVQHHINNSPGELEINNLKKLSNDILQPIRNANKKPIHVNSGYRCSLLNTKIGGVSTSQHVKGQAADIDNGDNENKILFKLIVSLIKSKKITVGQLIWENNGKWIHISLPMPGKINQILDISK